MVRSLGEAGMTSDLYAWFPDVRRELVAAAEARFAPLELGEGVVVIEEGEEDVSAMLVCRGEVLVRTGDLEIATVGEGGLIGEIALFGGNLRVATVETVTECRFMMLERSDYEVLLHLGSPVAYSLEKRALRQLAARLREVDSRIAEAGEPHRLSRDPEAIGSDGPADVDPLRTLVNSRFFEGTPASALVPIAERFVPRVYAPGEMLCRQGAAGDAVYLLVDGAVEVVVSSAGGESGQLAVLEPGDVFGMAPLLEDRPRMASCVALEKTTVLRMSRLDGRDLSRLENRTGSSFRTAIIRALGDQVAFANAQLALRHMTRGRLARAGIEAQGQHLYYGRR